MGLAGIAYTYVRPAPGTMVRPGRASRAGRQEIGWASGASGGRLSFRNPQGRAEVLVLDLQGHMLAKYTGVGGSSVIFTPDASHGVLLFTVRARGLPPGSRLLTMP